MKFTVSLPVAAVFAAALPVPDAEPILEEVATFPTQQVTDVTGSARGRVFVNFPFGPSPLRKITHGGQSKQQGHFAAYRLKLP